MIYVCREVRQKYTEMIQLMESKYLFWVYNTGPHLAEHTIPHFSDKTLGFCTDHHTLILTLNLWKAMHKMWQEVLKEDPFPPIKKINPALIILKEGFMLTPGKKQTT